LERCGRKRPWLNLMYYPQICLQENQANLSWVQQVPLPRLEPRTELMICPRSALSLAAHLSASPRQSDRRGTSARQPARVTDCPQIQARVSINVFTSWPFRKLMWREDAGSDEQSHLSDCASTMNPHCRSWLLHSPSSSANPCAQKMTDFHEILYERYATGGLHSGVHFNLLQSVITCRLRDYLGWKGH
jgi:hypothetical protein